MSRKTARETLMKAAFQMEGQKDDSRESLEIFLRDQELSAKDRDYIEQTFDTLKEHREEIDRLIDQHARNWDVKRLPKTDLAILRLAVCECLYSEDIPDQVAVNEAVELAKKYCGEKAPGFINGVLGGILKDR